MNLYSHLVFAQVLEPDAAPENRSDYYWGAVAPDIRYLAGMRRDQTHLSRRQLAALTGQHPELRSFLLGYTVHCLLDEINLTHLIFSKLPLRLLRGVFSLRQSAVLLELYLQEKVRLDLQVRVSNNVFLSGLGVHPAHIETFASALNQYLASPSVETMISISRSFGLVEDARVQKYIQGAAAISRNRLVKGALFGSVKSANVEDIAAAHVRLALHRMGVSAPAPKE